MCSLDCSTQFISIFENCQGQPLMEGFSVEDMAQWTTFYGQCQEVEEATAEMGALQPVNVKMFRILISSDADQAQVEMFGGQEQSPPIIGPLPKFPFPLPPPPPSPSPSSSTELVQHHAQCTTANILICVSACNATHHGYELLATIDGTDTKFSCSLANMLYSWVGAVALGGFLGQNVAAFVSAVISGAAGTYVLTLALADANVGNDLTVQPGQNVIISGDVGLVEWSSWGSGGFTFGEVAALTLTFLTLAGSLSVSISANQRTVSDCMLVGGMIELQDATAVFTGTFFGGRGLSSSGGSVIVFGCSELGSSVSLSVAGSIDISASNMTGTSFSVTGGGSLSIVTSFGSIDGIRVTDSSFALDAASTVTLGGSISFTNAGEVTLGDQTFVDQASLTVEVGTECTIASSNLSTFVSLEVVDGGYFSISTLALAPEVLAALTTNIVGTLALNTVTVAGIAGTLTGTIIATSDQKLYNPVGFTGAFEVASGPCTVLGGGRCVGRGEYQVEEECSITVVTTGALGACPFFQVTNYATCVGGACDAMAGLCNGLTSNGGCSSMYKDPCNRERIDGGW
jgi:hypothetical protein